MRYLSHSSEWQTLAPVDLSRVDEDRDTVGTFNTAAKNTKYTSVLESSFVLSTYSSAIAFELFDLTENKRIFSHALVHKLRAYLHKKQKFHEPVGEAL